MGDEEWLCENSGCILPAVGLFPTHPGPIFLLCGIHMVAYGTIVFYGDIRVW